MKFMTTSFMPRTNLYYDPFPWNILRGNMEDPNESFNAGINC